MLRSMYAGISGMKGFQTKLDVIGNNIANVNTSGFKKGRTTFQDMMSQSLSGAEGPVVQNGDALRGGINPSQVGLGSQVGSVDNIQTQGNRQTTNRPLDLALEGDGMFVLGQNLVNPLDGNGNPDPTQGVDLAETTINFTRAGNFYLDNDGYIVNSDGKYLLGENNGNVDRLQIPAEAASFSIQNNGAVTYVDETGVVQNAGQIRLANFSNPGGLEKSGSNTFQLTINAGVFTDDGNFDSVNDLVIPEQNGTASVVSGALEMSNVDLAEEFTEMIVAQRGFQANTRIITTSDEILQELVNLKR
ncbi:flagellar basal body rod protein FlgG [Aquibacillus sp. 3ASR75-11]|uniref:Flagellar hook protein FlgE n=1 Tax=Terrihalobacillus insolitus TaxID=2950438 RepID=A0A9X3WPK9_9BACI|nr:flagellar basal body rod protein FlgG [Terrihalobacillus insolitus]MDC3414131.1 flagellar basal body rod protein FlgG [Terrihalobacillus insolitus]MDC3423572.1 flagellar basal body rod protein FlgG [Terrihalobacillus insolitus]